jgi:hypothetical protein
MQLAQLLAERMQFAASCNEVCRKRGSAEDILLTAYLGALDQQKEIATGERATAWLWPASK